MINFYSGIKRTLLKFSCIILALLILTPIYPKAAKAQDITVDDIKSVLGNTENYDPNSQVCETTSTTISGDDAVATIFNFFTSKGLTDFQAAGIMGNMFHESGYEPRKFQNVFDDEDEQRYFNQGVLTNYTPDDGGLVNAEDIDLQVADENDFGWGLVGWTPPGKMITPSIDAGKDPNNIITQLDFVWSELTSTNINGIADELMATTDVASATLLFETKYERHAGAPQPKRIVEAERVLELAHSNGLAQTNVSGDVYILGDSITVGATELYSSKFEAKQITPTISAVSGRSWKVAGDPSSGSTGTTGTGEEALNTDSDSVKAASAVVIALGTNGYTTNNPIQEVINKVKQVNGNAPIFWVNVANGPPNNSDVPSFNSELQTHNGTDIQVIDWAATVDPSGDGTKDPSGLLSDTTHPTADGYAKLTDLVVSNVSGGVGIVGASSDGSCGSSSPGNVNGLTEAVLTYAWPEYHSPPFFELKPEYASLVAEAQANGGYVGGGAHPGVDCGGWVTRLMIASGFEPNYNNQGLAANGAGNVKYGQKPWLDANWEKIGIVTSSSQLQPGDVAIALDAGHTYAYVGQIEGFESQIASASYSTSGQSWRAPMAGHEALVTPDYNWYRKK